MLSPPLHSQEGDWLEKEKRVVVIHRLHQILEPFMLRRQVGGQHGLWKGGLVIRRLPCPDTCAAHLPPTHSVTHTRPCACCPPAYV